jgi:hypothetical protein
VQGVEARFMVIIGNERYDQHALNGLGKNAWDRSIVRAPSDRKIASEMWFMWLPGEKTWLAVRNVLTVDGRAIDNSQQRLDRLLAGSVPIGVARLRQLRDEGARFNLGSIRRNFNDPMLPLRFLEPESQPRFKFALAGEEKVNGAATSKVTFEEEGRPTVIQDNGRDRPSHGALWIAADGSVMRTRLEVGDRLRGLTASVSVDYNREPKLDLLVPVTMHELYMAISSTDTSGPLGAVSERIECEARYSNYRRFETSTRIVPD